MPRSNVVITGTGLVSSIGIGCDSYLRALLDCKSGITSLANRVDDGPQPGNHSGPPGLWIGGPILDFDAKQFIRPRKALKVMCREIQTAFAASQMAVEKAGLADAVPANQSNQFDPQAFGTVFGSEMFYGPPPEMEDSIRDCIDSQGRLNPEHFGKAAMKQITPLWMLKYLPNMPACHVGIALQAHGPNNSLILGDISGPAAVIEAASCLERGIASVMIAGATGTRLSSMRMNYRGDLPVPEVMEPIEFSSRPHDPTSQGVVGGEGAASLVLETSEHAARRGATPMARIISYASRFVPAGGMLQSVRSSKMGDFTTRGSSKAICLAVETALRDAGITRQQLGLIVSHGMGDPACDAAEQEAIQATLAGVPMVATIAALGHTGAACGMIDLTTGVLALREAVVPPTVYADGLEPKAAFVRKPQSLDEKYILCLSHNPEGNATAIVLASA